MKYVFMHIPKCAGTTVHNYLLRNVPEDRVCPERFNNLHAMPQQDLEKFDIFSAHMDFAAVRWIPGQKYTMTTLREPKARIVSLYKFWRSQDRSHAFRNRLDGPLAAMSLSFTEFLRHQSHGIQGNVRNAMVRNFLGRSWSDERGSLVIDDAAALELAFANLQSFDLIGFMDDLAPMFEALSRSLGVEAPLAIPRDNKTRFENNDQEFQSEEALALLDELTHLDRVFYERAKELVAERSRPAEPFITMKRRFLRALS